MTNTYGPHIRALQHRKDCEIYKARIERVLKSHKAAMGYCTCDVYDPLRTEQEKEQ